jgi:hypothetical protein
VPHLHVPDLRRPRMPDLPRLRMPDLWRRRMRNASFSAAMRRSLWGRPSGRSATEARLVAIPEKFYYVPLPGLSFLLRVPRSFSAAIGRGLGHSGRRVVWASLRADARLVQTWWASHAADAVIGTVAIASAVVVGVVVARL